MNLKVNVKKLNENAELPKYAKPFDAGFDLVAIEETAMDARETVIVKTGLAFEIPYGYEMQVRPRSGISRKTDLRVILGTIDSGYRGEVGVIVENTGYSTRIIEKGTRIAQGVISPVVTAVFMEEQELSETDRGEGGFGSTGIK